MKLWMKAAIFGSIFMVFFFYWQMQKAEKAKYTADPQYTEAIALPQPLIRKEIKKEELLINIPEDEEPFRQLFFETMELKGIQQDASGRCLAIFTDGTKKHSSRLLKFAAGDTHDGITLESVDMNGCLVKYGNIERKFKLR